jgi:hypothetical protein
MTKHAFNRLTEGPGLTGFTRIAYDRGETIKPHHADASNATGQIALSGVKPPARIDPAQAWEKLGPASESSDDLALTAPEKQQLADMRVQTGLRNLEEEGAAEARRKALATLPESDPARQIATQQSPDLSENPQPPLTTENVTTHASHAVRRPGDWLAAEIARLEAQQAAEAPSSAGADPHPPTGPNGPLRS